MAVTANELREYHEGKSKMERSELLDCCKYLVSGLKAYSLFIRFYYANDELKNEIKNITKNNVRKIIEMGVDIIVIACNTATSVAIEELRGIYKDKYIIGTEPAVKVAADKNPNSYGFAGHRRQALWPGLRPGGPDGPGPAALSERS